MPLPNSARRHSLLGERKFVFKWGTVVAIRFDTSLDTEFIEIHVEKQGTHPELIIVLDRQAFNSILQDDPRPPEVLLDLIAQRALKRMPVPNGDDNRRLITSYNLSLVWPR